jgi:hypothetical protein
MPRAAKAGPGRGEGRENGRMNTRKPDDAPDLTRVLDGWTPKPGRGAATPDPTRVLDGWKPAAGVRGPLPADVQPGTRALPAEPARLPEGLDLRGSARAAKRGRADDVVDAVWKPSAQVRQAALDAGAAPADADWQPSRSGAFGPALSPRLLAEWKPGAWIGAVRQVFESVARVVNTPQGPVVDSWPPHVLLALWPPQSAAQPFLDRWPQRVALSAVAHDDAPLELLKLMPDDAELWLAEHDIDWVLIGEAVMLHEPALRDFQLKELRRFVEAERQATWERANKAYRLPGTGQPLERV